jgi:hypothetical protein
MIQNKFNKKEHYEKETPALNDLFEAAYKLAENTPYIVNALVNICENQKEIISRKDDEHETHYKIIISEEEFYKYAMNPRLNENSNIDKNKKTAMKELTTICKSPKSELLPLDPDGKNVIQTQKLKVGIKNIPDSSPEFIIEFYKPIWTPFLKNYPQPWFFCIRDTNVDLFDPERDRQIFSCFFDDGE